jgi:hypothetical protein
VRDDETVICDRRSTIAASSAAMVAGRRVGVAGGDIL